MLSRRGRRAPCLRLAATGVRFCARPPPLVPRIRGRSGRTTVPGRRRRGIPGMKSRGNGTVTLFPAFLLRRRWIAPPRRKALLPLEGKGTQRRPGRQQHRAPINGAAKMRRRLSALRPLQKGEKIPPPMAIQLAPGGRQKQKPTTSHPLAATTGRTHHMERMRFSSRRCRRTQPQDRRLHPPPLELERGQRGAGPGRTTGR